MDKFIGNAGRQHFDDTLALNAEFVTMPILPKFTLPKFISRIKWWTVLGAVLVFVPWVPIITAIRYRHAIFAFIRHIL